MLAEYNGLAEGSANVGGIYCGKLICCSYCVVVYYVVCLRVVLVYLYVVFLRIV